VTARRATALLMAAATLASPAGALADGDPASDVLLVQDAFYPYFPPPAKPLSRTLDALLREVRRKGYPMKVAMIAGRGDLGAYPNLLGKPGPYAKLLESEIVFRVRKPHLLVLMPGGAAGRNLAAGSDVPAQLDIPKDAKPDDLVRAALQAVARIATANGHPAQVPDVAAAAGEQDGGGGAGTGLYVLAGVIVLLGLGLIAVSIRSRQHVGREHRDDDDGADAGEQGH
jgi:hypothetical protein